MEVHCCHFQSDFPDDSSSDGGSPFYIKKLIPLFGNRPTISMASDVSQTVTCILFDRQFARSRSLAKSTAQGVHLAASALEARTVFVAGFQIATDEIFAQKSHSDKFRQI
jgi:hypothetical protein